MTSIPFKILAILKLLIFLIVTPFMVIAHQLYYFMTKDFISIAMWYHRFLCSLFGIKITVYGTPPKDGQTIILSNHLSYLDILALGGIVETVFISKDDVANWPLFGFLANLQKTVYISRSRSGLQEAKDMIAERLKIGQNLVLFPEGTSTRGETVFPFKSSLLAVFEKAEPQPVIQPVAIKNKCLNGKAISTHEQRDKYAWHIEDDLEIHEHLWIMAQQRSMELEIHFLEPLKISDFTDRKELAAETHEKIAQVVTGHA